ncbi:MAG: hypothetical protein ACRD6X_20590, partial [Pyrinomonadaceae bacterium]
MKTELLLILFVIFALFVLTAVRYRKQIGAVYQFWKLIKQARIQGGQRMNEMNQPAESGRVQLVN